MTVSLHKATSEQYTRISLGREMYPLSPRSFARALVIETLAFWQSIRSGSDTSNRVDILLLHNVFPDEVSGFRRMLAKLSETYAFIGYNEAVCRIHSGQIDKRYLAFSFDDGLKNCLDAASILEEFDARSCFFVCPDIVGPQSEEQIQKFCHERLRHGPVDFMNWDDLASLKARGHEIGGHTIGHIDIGTSPMSEVHDNLSDCRRIIINKLGDCDHFAWPFGRFTNFTGEAENTVFEVGFLSCASGERGSHRPTYGHQYRSTRILRRQSVQANWRQSHIDFFLNRIAQEPCPWEMSREA